MSEQTAPPRPEVERLRKSVKRDFDNALVNMSLLGSADPRLKPADGDKVVIDCAVEVIALSLIGSKAEDDWISAEAVRVAILSKVGEYRENLKRHREFAVDFLAALAAAQEARK